MNSDQSPLLHLPISHNHRSLPTPGPDAQTIIRSMGLKVTQQRVTLIEIIQKNKNHLTAQEIYRRVSVVNPDMGPATVYRFLRTLSQHGFVSEVRVGGLPARYEWGGKKHHDHLTCTQCGLVCEFENQDIEQLQDQIANHFGFTLTGHILELFGLCPRCKDRQSENATSLQNGSPRIPS